MSTLAEHPTVRSFEAKRAALAAEPARTPLEATWLRQVCLDAGAGGGVSDGGHLVDLLGRVMEAWCVG